MLAGATQFRSLREGWTLRFPDCRWRLLGECELPATQLQQQIVSAVKNTPLKPTEIAELLDTSADSISHILPKLLKKGLVIKPSYGHPVFLQHPTQVPAL